MEPAPAIEQSREKSSRTGRNVRAGFTGTPQCYEVPEERVERAARARIGMQRAVIGSMNVRMTQTKNAIPAKTRRQMAELLNARLADATDLYTHAKHVHWNIRGERFLSPH